jgi:hypothetical protein
MNLYQAPVSTVAEFLRWVKALGSHRYVAGSLHMIHALVYDACAEAVSPASLAWARETLSVSERVGEDDLRRANDLELLQILEAVLTRTEVRTRLELALRTRSIDVQSQLGAGFALFDEARESTLSPVLIDAGWELFALSDLDAERHRGVLDRMPADTAVAPDTVLQELGLFGAEELLLLAQNDLSLASAPTLWVSEPAFYQNYVLHGVSRAAKLATW